MDTGDTAWLLASTALVMLMVPGLAFFYGGMVRAKSVLNIMMMVFYALAISRSSGSSAATLRVRQRHRRRAAGRRRVPRAQEHHAWRRCPARIPTYVFVVFQMLFGVITIGLVAGAIADRAKFSAWMVFVPIWVTFVYVPVAHWVFAFDGDTTKGGWIANQLGAFDFAGGTAVEVELRHVGARPGHHRRSPRRVEA